MGNIFNFKSQPKEIRIIYVHSNDKSETTYPLVWSDSFAQFVLDLYELFPQTRSLKKTKFLFRDGTERPVCILNESTFAALVPKHKQISPMVDVYYCILESWLV